VLHRLESLCHRVKRTFRNISPVTRNRKLKTENWLLILGLDQAQNVMVKNQDHQRQDQHQAQALGHLPVLDLYGFAPDSLNPEEKQVAAIQNGDGQEVEQEEVDAFRARSL
jgi:hypothetical protein